MTHQTMFALDDVTATRIRRLAAQWQVSQAEAIRRVGAQSDAASNPDPVAMLNARHRAVRAADERLVAPTFAWLKFL